MSIPAAPKTSLLAAATYALPGPVITSALGMLSVPYASAAIACAPPTLNILSTPAISAATNVSGSISPDFPGGVTIIISSTPAIFAGIIFMSTLEG